jgi:hypothetical protein
MTWETMAPFLRHALQFGAGLLVAKGIFDAASAVEIVKQLETIIGAVVSVLAVYGYVKSK